ncbi:MAG TPA: carboxymuconolactone decarboxylase family protein [Acidimicrobiales bacterium]|jgi:alkylhydroperoxidase family enzyme|nr:carboxymuconolactone decarboxylase family protein [Acidimicrobiales bacterium]
MAPRLRQVPKSEAEAPIVTTMYDYIFDGRDPVAEPGTATGSPGDWWTVFALVPDVLEHSVQGFALYQSPNRRLAPRLREIAQTRVGWAAGSQFVFSQHCKSLRTLGISDDVVSAIPHWAAATCFDETERLVLAYMDCLVFDRGRVPDGLFDALRQHLSDEEILELTYIGSLYLQHAVMSRALRTEFDDRAEPVVEVDAPEASDAGPLTS